MTSKPLRARLNFARHYLRSAAANPPQDAVCPMLAAPHRPDPAEWRDDRITVSWLGHATVLANFLGAWFLTDPALEARIGIGRGLAKFGPRRLVAPALRPRELPPLDLLLLSHAHMDHTDLGTLRFLSRDVPVVVQPGPRLPTDQLTSLPVLSESGSSTSEPISEPFAPKVSPEMADRSGSQGSETS